MKLKEAPPYGNVASRMAAWFIASASRRTPARRWIILLALLALWLTAGYIAWSAAGKGVTESIYRVFGALALTDSYVDVDPKNITLEAARFAGFAIPLVGLLFAFSGSFGRSLSQAFNSGAANHVVIAGSGPGAMSLAHDCLRKGDSVILIARGVPEETQWLLARRGGYVIEGDPTRIETLRVAGAHRAAHVVAFEEDEAANLQIEALMRRLLVNTKRREPVVVHVATKSPGLLQEARDMRSQEQRKRDAKKDAAASPIDPRPFSLDEISARALIQDQATTILSLAAQLGQQRPHIVFFGFDDSAEAVAVRVFMSVWSAKLEAPRVTVLTPDAESHERRFQARYPHAFAHPGIWIADIKFVPFVSSERKIDRELLAHINETREPPTALVVSTGNDSQNILLALSLKRTCNEDHFWPTPVFMHETNQSEFSLQYAKGDDTPELDAYLQAFGAGQLTATRRYILEGRLDMAAAMHHQHYTRGMSGRTDISHTELQAAAKDWDEVRETYRDANRAGADAVMVRLWDAGWRAAAASERPDTQAEPDIPDAMMESMARREHDRWNAERLLNGWRPGAKRDNILRVHPNLTTWENLTQDERDRDVVQVRASLDVARMLHPRGFMRSA